MSGRSWATYQLTYRAKEMAVLAHWIQIGASGAVVGPAGSGKSNLLGFLGHRYDALRSYFSPYFPADSVALVPLDLNSLPAPDIATLYRALFRSFYEVRHHFSLSLQQMMTHLYQANWTEADPFLLQSLLRELLRHFQRQHVRVILILDRFDHFCNQANPQTLDTLRGLRDSFKDTLCFIVGMRTEVAYLPAPELLGELYEILDSRICWVGPMNEHDARQLILEETQIPLQLKGNEDLVAGQASREDDLAAKLTEEEIYHLLALTGGYPALLKAACSWWLATPDRPAISHWETALLAQQPIKYRLAEIWAGLTQEEQLALAEVQKWYSQIRSRQKALSGMPKGLEERHGEILAHLATKGLCGRIEEDWYIQEGLLASYIAAAEGRGTGRVWIDERTEEFYQGERILEGLEPREQAVLSFLVKQPRTRHTHTHLIESTWPGDQIYKEGISPDSLYQVIRKLRKRIEPNPAKPCYIVTWRGTPEGGYQFFPEGRPG